MFARTRLRGRIAELGAAVMVTGFLLAGCGSSAAEETDAEGPYSLEQVNGSDIPRIHLTALAAKRLDIQVGRVESKVAPPRLGVLSGSTGSGPAGTPAVTSTASPAPAASAAPLAAGERLVIPFAAVLYNPDGSAFTYANPEPLVYVRTPLTLDYVSGDVAVLSAGPSAGTSVVVVGGSELLGSELGVGDE